MPSGPFLDSWNFGASLSLFLQGVLCAQFAHYTSLNKRDSMWIKLFVAGLALLTTLKSLHSLAMMWIENVATFGSPEAGFNPWRKYWLPKITVILEAIAIFYIQMFFCHRLWAISRNPYLVIVCIILFLSGLISGAVMTFYFFTAIESIRGWMGAHLGTMLCGDLVLTGSTIFYLLRHSRACVLSHSPATTILNSLRRVTLQSAAPAALCALINFAADMRIKKPILEPGLVLLAFIANMVLPYLYAWSAMWTLNSREDICLTAANCPYTFNLGVSVGSSNSEATRGQHPDNLEPVAKVERAPLDGAPESMA